MEVVKKKTKKNPRGSVLIKAQELTFVKALAGNNKPLRDRALKRLRKWFKARSQGTFQFVEDDFMRLWKGIFYSMWMSDKPLVQEELAESIADLVHAFSTPAQAMLFVKCFFATMGLEWFGLDQLRLNKFQMLVRRFLRQTLEYSRRRGWDGAVARQLNAALEETVLSCVGAPYPLGLVLHFFDIFLEELAKVGGEDMPEEVILLFLPSLVEYWIRSDQATARASLMTNIIDQLIHQTDVGLEHKARFTAWAQAGFPGESMDDMEPVEADPEEDPEEHPEEHPRVKDPRAGHVDVLLPQIRFDPARVADMFTRRRGEVEGKMRRVLAKQAKKFVDLSAGVYPFAHRHRIPRSVNLGVMRRDKRDAEGAIWEAAQELDSYVTGLDRAPSEVAPPVGQQSKREGVPDEVRFQRFLDHGATFRINSLGVSVPKKRKLSGKNKPEVKEVNADESSTPKCTSTSPRWTVVESSPPGPLNAGEAGIVEKKKKRASAVNGEVAGVTPLGRTSNGPPLEVGAVSTPPAAEGRKRFTLYTPDVNLSDFPFPTLYPDEAVLLSPRADPMMLEQRSPQLITRLPGSSSGGKKSKSPGMRSPLAVDNTGKNTPKSGTPGSVITPGSIKNTPKSGTPGSVITPGSIKNTPKSGTPGSVITPGSSINTPKPVIAVMGTTPVLTNSSARKEAPPALANSSANKEAPPALANSSARKEASPALANSSARKEASPALANSSARKEASPALANSSARKEASPVLANSSARKEASPALANSSARKEATTHITPKSSLHAKTAASNDASRIGDHATSSGGKNSHKPGHDADALVTGNTPGLVPARVRTPGSGDKGAGDSSRKSPPGVVKTPDRGEGRSGMSPRKKRSPVTDAGEVQVSPKCAVKRKMSAPGFPGKRRSLEDPEQSPDRAENKVLSALVRGEEVTRRTSPRKNKGAGADEMADTVTALPGRRLSLNMVTPGKRQTAVKRLSMGSLLEGEGEVPSSPKRTSLRLAQKKTVRTKGRSPPARLLTLTPAQLLKTPGATADLVTSAKRVSLVSRGKKVNIALKHNVAQEVHEYHEALRGSPGIPFDAARRPTQGVLKAAPVPSPVNPFYLLEENSGLNRLRRQ